MKFKSVMRWDSNAKLFRIFRIMWYRGKWGKGGYSAKLSFAFRPRFFLIVDEFEGYDVTILGIRIHYQRSYGGIHV